MTIQQVDSNCWHAWAPFDRWLGANSIDTLKDRIKFKVTHQGYGEYWRQAQIEARTEANKHRVEIGAPLYMEYLGYKFYGKGNWFFAINADGEWATAESRDSIKYAVQRKEGVNPYKSIAI